MFAIKYEQNSDKGRIHNACGSHLGTLAARMVTKHGLELTIAKFTNDYRQIEEKDLIEMHQAFKEIGAKVSYA